MGFLLAYYPNVVSAFKCESQGDPKTKLDRRSNGESYPLPRRRVGECCLNAQFPEKSVIDTHLAESRLSSITTIFLPLATHLNILQYNSSPRGTGFNGVLMSMISLLKATFRESLKSEVEVF